jgi:hypothetical protein
VQYMLEVKPINRYVLLNASFIGRGQDYIFVRMIVEMRLMTKVMKKTSSAILCVMETSQIVD